MKTTKLKLRGLVKAHRAAELIESGKTVKEIAKEFGNRELAVYAMLRKVGCHLGQAQKRLTDTQKTLVTNLYNEGYTATSIAEELKASYVAVSGYIRRNVKRK